MDCVAAALCIPTLARMVHENAADDLRTEREKVHAVLASDTARANQFEVSLVRQGGGLQRLAGLSVAQVLPGDAAQFRVNGRNQAAEGLFITVSPGGNQSADISW